MVRRIRTNMYGQFTRMTKLQEKEILKTQTLRKRFIDRKHPTNYRGGSLISWGNSGHEKQNTRQYREVAPKGTYFYKRAKGITTWYKRKII